jgi:hypothetical protein
MAFRRIAVTANAFRAYLRDSRANGSIDDEVAPSRNAAE